MAIEHVLAEVAREFGGEDPLHPVMRGFIDKSRRTLWILYSFLSGEDAVNLTEPSEEALEVARTHFDRGLDLMGRI